MPSYKHFAIAGASGTVGSHFLDAFEHSEDGYNVTILTRKTGGNEAFAQQWKKKGAKVFAVDYEDEASLVSALSRIEVVISTLRGPAFAVQVPIVKAAKKAGVKLYINSHWGVPLTARELPNLEPVNEFRIAAFKLGELRDAAPKVAEEVGLPWIEFRNGIFPECFVPRPISGLSQLKDRRASAYGDGRADVSWTTQADVTRYVLYVLRHLPEEELHNRIFNIQGDVKSFNEIVQLYETKYPGSPVDVIYRPIAELESQVEDSERDDRIVRTLMLAIVTGKAKHHQDLLDNKQYPDWHPKGVVDML